MSQSLSNTLVLYLCRSSITRRSAKSRRAIEGTGKFFRRLPSPIMSSVERRPTDGKKLDKVIGKSKSNQNQNQNKIKKSKSKKIYYFLLKKQQTNETQLIIPHPPSFNDGFILNF